MPDGIVMSRLMRLAQVTLLCCGLLGDAAASAQETSADASAKESPEKPADSRHLDQCQIYPLNVGREWSFRSGPLELIERVAKHELIEGELCARVETEFNGKIVNYEHLTVRKDGVYRVAVAGRAVVPPLQFVQLPLKPGSTWTVDSKIVGESVKGRFKLGQSTVKIGDQELDAVLVEGVDFKAGKTDLGFTYFFVPGVGKVKQVVKVGEQSTTLELPTLNPAEDRERPRTVRRQ